MRVFAVAVLVFALVEILLEASYAERKWFAKAEKLIPAIASPFQFAALFVDDDDDDDDDDNNNNNNDDGCSPAVAVESNLDPFGVYCSDGMLVVVAAFSSNEAKSYRARHVIRKSPHGPSSRMLLS